MRIWLQVSMVVLGVGLAACNLDPSKSCQSNDDCTGGGRCDTASNTCVIATCAQKCDFGDYCDSTKATCAVAHTGSEVTSPLAGKVGATVKVHARLTPVQTAPHEDPTTLEVTVTASAGGGTEAVQLSQVPEEEGEYEGSWQPSASGAYELKVMDERFPSAAVKVTADKDGPSFWVEVSPHATRPDDGGTKYGDVGMPNAYRRDETVKVEVKSNDVDVDPASVRVAVTGTGAAWDAGMPVEVTSGCDAAYCGELAQMPLSGPEMKAYHTGFTVSASGMDDGGNPGKLLDAGSLDVTRFKWTFTVPDQREIVASPAIGRDGTVYVGTADTSPVYVGTLYAVSPDGKVRWAMDAGAVEVNPAVGADAGGYEHVFVAGAYDAGSGNMFALDSRDGGVLNHCDETPRPMAGPAVSTTTIGGVPSDTATMGGGDDTLYAFRADISGGSNHCLPSGAMAAAPSGTVVIQGSRYFVPGATLPKLLWGDFGSANWTSVGAADTASVPISIAIDGTQLFLAQSTGLGLLNIDGTNYTPNNLSGAPTSGPVVGPANAGYTGAGSGLVDVDLTSLATASIRGTDPTNSILLGEGNRLFATSGTSLQAWQRDGTAFEWEASGVAVSDVPLTIDCTRDDTGTAISAPGVVYVKSGSTSLSAIVVDSHGIDTTAPWPKYQHDPRNSGNVDTPMTDFVCP